MKLLLITLLLTVQPALAQHEGHQQPPKKDQTKEKAAAPVKRDEERRVPIEIESINAPRPLVFNS